MGYCRSDLSPHSTLRGCSLRRRSQCLEGHRFVGQNRRPDGAFDPAIRVKDMDTDGLRAEVLYPDRCLGVFGAALRLFPWYAEDNIKTPFYDNDTVSQIVSLVLFIGLCVYLWVDSTRRVRSDENV